MLKIVGDDIMREGKKIGWLEGNDVFDKTGRKLGHFSGNDVFNREGRKIGWIDDNKLWTASDTKISLEELNRGIEGGIWGTLARAAVRLLLGD